MSVAPAPRRYAITVYGRLPVANELLRQHRMAVHRSHQQWTEWTRFALIAARVPPLGRVRLVCTRYAPGNRQPDGDGVATGFKPALDAIQEAGVIPNDDPAHLVAEYRAVRCLPGEARVEIEIEEVCG